MQIFQLIFASLALAMTQPSLTMHAEDEAISVKLLHARASTNISTLNRSEDLGDMRGVHEFAVSLEISAKDSESLYCLYSRNYSVVSQDEHGKPFVRSRAHEQVPPFGFSWLGQDLEGSFFERVRKSINLGFTNKCDRIPSSVDLFEVQFPVWKAKEVEHVTVLITQDKVWQTLPNGSRVMAVITNDRGEYKNVSIYRENALSENGDLIPPPFHISKVVKEDGEELRHLGGTPKKRGLNPDNPEQAHIKKIIRFDQRFHPERDTPESVVIAVVHEYEDMHVRFRLEDFSLGETVSYDKVSP